MSGEKLSPQFPLVDAILVTPETSSNGGLAICTNATMAPGQVYSEIEPGNNGQVAVLGSLKVNRDGAERMIINSIVHPTVQQIILFGTETSAFRPSTNLLQALQFGVDPQDANRIINGHNSSAQYPNLRQSHIDYFRDNVTVLPIYMSEARGKSDIVASYLEWLEGRVDSSTLDVLRDINARPNKIYFDSLNRLIKHLGGSAAREKVTLALDPSEFQHLQPPLVEITTGNEVPEVPFRVSSDGSRIVVEMIVGGRTVSISETEPFLLGYSIMKRLGSDKDLLSPQEQLILGAEVARITTEMNNGVTAQSPFGISQGDFNGAETLLSEPSVRAKMDSQYYYIVGLKKDKKISVLCLANDQCEQVYEVRADNATDIIAKLAEDNRFEDYEMDFLHRFDVGMQIGRADIAVRNGYEFVQDFDNIFKINTQELPLVTVEADSFLAVHRDLLRKIYTRGLTAEHGDRQKGLTRSVAALAILRGADQALQTMPRVYKQGDQSTDMMREEYANQLLRFDHDGGYSYGERTRSYFGYDQLEAAVDGLGTDRSKAFVVQRFDPTHDMFYGIDPDSGKPTSSEDPCLTHDIYFAIDGILHSFHIARAHNIVNAYPENVFGLHDAYTSKVAAGLGLPMGDMFMLSNRANILLLTEEQKASKIISMPVKPMDDDLPIRSGPYKYGENILEPNLRGGVMYTERPIVATKKRPSSSFLDRIESLNGVDTLQRAIDYLQNKGMDHNNPVLSSYLPNESAKFEAQQPQLAFFQANMVGDKLYATAVFTNRTPEDMEDDLEVANYLATRYSDELGLQPGTLVLYSIGGSG